MPEDQTLRLSFEPQAIREHFEGDEGPLADLVAIARDEDLRRIGESAITYDSLYRVFHEALVYAATDFFELPT